MKIFPGAVNYEKNPQANHGYIIVLGLRTKKQKTSLTSRCTFSLHTAHMLSQLLSLCPLLFCPWETFSPFFFLQHIPGGPVAIATLIPLYPPIEVTPVEVKKASKRSNSSCPPPFLTPRRKKEVHISLACHFLDKAQLVHKWLNN